MALQRLTRTRYQLVKQLVRKKQLFLENLTYKCNTLIRELRELDGTMTVFSTTVMSLMAEDYSLGELAEIPLVDFATLLQEKDKGQFKYPEKLAKAIKRAITNSYRLGTIDQEFIDIVLRILVREIRALEAIIKDLDKAFEQLVVILPEYQCLTSISDVGKAYDAGMIADIDQIERFEDQTKLAKYAGLSWKVKLWELSI